MKKWCFLLAILCLLPSCGRQHPALQIETAETRALATYGTDELRRVDDDFVRTSFGTPDYVKKVSVYFTANGDGTEIGFFQLTDAAYAGKMKGVIQDYLNSERQAVESLAALYPGQELERRISRFEHAVVEAHGTLVFYVLADDEQREKILHALTRA